MMQKLPSSTVKLITSTQVITSIHSVIKELVENSLDAGADSIDVRLEKGGLEKIEVIDNGTGISTTDIQFLCKPHYTSKIKNESDLLELISYGFRGEAVYSLCSVAEVAVTTKTKDDYVSKMYTFDKLGEIAEQKPTHHNIGTIMSVSKIFKDIPVRRQIYKPKKLKEELTLIEGLLIGYGLSHPKLRITLSNDKNMIWRKNRTSEYVYNYAISEILGKKVCDNLTELNIEEEDFEVKYFVPKVDCDIDVVTRSLPDRLFMFVNERPVILAEIKSLLKKSLNAKYSFGKNRWPISIVFIKVKPDLVDVNLEPNKTRILLLNMDEILEKSKILLDSLYAPQIEEVGDPSQELFSRTGDTNISFENVTHFEQDISELPESILQRNFCKESSIETTQVLDENFFDDNFDIRNPEKSVNDSDKLVSTVGNMNDDESIVRTFEATNFKNMVNDHDLSSANENEETNCSNPEKQINMEDWSKGNVAAFDICTPVRIHRSELNQNENTPFNTCQKSIADSFVLEISDHNESLLRNSINNDFNTPLKVLQSTLISNNHSVKKRKLEEGKSTAKKKKSNSTVPFLVDGQKKLLESGMFLKGNISNTDLVCDFQLDKIKKQFVNINTVETARKDIYSVGKLEKQHSTLWFVVIRQKLFLIDNARLMEKLLFEKMVKSHTFKPQKLLSSIILSAENIGIENYLCLYEIKELNIDGIEKSISHSLLTNNGVLITRMINSEDSVVKLIWTHRPLEIPNFDLDNLIEIIHHVKKNSNFYRPAKVRNWLKNEVKRLSQDTATLCFSSELEENIKELEKISDEKLELQSCVHGHPIMLPIKSIKYL